MLPLRAFPGTKKAAVAAEPAKSPAAQEPTEKPASGRVSGQLLQMINVSDRLMFSFDPLHHLHPGAEIWDMSESFLEVYRVLATSFICHHFPRFMFTC